jgi:hypothetical protein
VLARHHGVAGGQPLRRQDVGLLTVRILDQRDEGRAVRIVLDPIDGRRRIEPAALEVDNAIGLLVTAAAETHRRTAVVVAAAGRVLALGQRLDRGAAMQARTVDDNELTQARRDWIEGLECHRALPTDPWSRRWCDPLRGSRWRA